MRGGGGGGGDGVVELRVHINRDQDCGKEPVPTAVLSISESVPDFIQFDWRVISIDSERSAAVIVLGNVRIFLPDVIFVQPNVSVQLVILLRSISE